MNGFLHFENGDRPPLPNSLNVLPETSQVRRVLHIEQVRLNDQKAPEKKIPL